MSLPFCKGQILENIHFLRKKFANDLGALQQLAEILESMTFVLVNCQDLLEAEPGLTQKPTLAPHYIIEAVTAWGRMK